MYAPGRCKHFEELGASGTHRGGFAGRGRRYADRTELTRHARSAAGLPATVCPCSPSDLALGVRRKRRRTPGNSSVGGWLSAPGGIPSSSAAPRRRAPLGAVGQPPTASEAWPRASHEPVPRRFAHRTTDMAPVLRHADPCRASPCRPRRLLPALNRARPRSRALSSPARRLPKAVMGPSMLRFESSSSFALSLGDLLVQTLFQRRTRRETPATQAS